MAVREAHNNIDNVSTLAHENFFFLTFLCFQYRCVIVTLCYSGGFDVSQIQPGSV